MVKNNISNTFSTVDFDAESLAGATDELELNEQELRLLYESEEIDQFLHLFSAYVTEVRVPEPVGRDKLHTCEPDTKNDESGELQSPISSQHNYQSISEEMAFRYLVPLLPQARPPPPAFTLGRLRLTTQRLYIATGPVFICFSKLTDLATWRNKRKSLIYCSLFWILWWYNLILPGFVLRIFITLIHRRLFPYPSLSELRQHREQLSRADVLGDQLSSRLTATSTFGVKEMWRMFRVVNLSKKNKTKGKIREMDASDTTVEEQDDPLQDATVLDDTDDSAEARSVKRATLYAMGEVADVLEKIRNIFLWRQPTSSRIYGAVLFIILLTTFFLPAQYLSKAIYFIFGLIFWHVTPILSSLPPPELARLPPLFADVPTDADYAMHLISQRVAAGLDVCPPKPKTKTKRRQSEPRSKINSKTIEKNNNNLDRPSPTTTFVTNDFTERERVEDESSEEEQNKNKGVDWKKLGNRATATGMTLGNAGMRFLQERNGNVGVEVHTYPAQHTTTPGLITITPTKFLFTPIMSQTPKTEIDLGSVRGVKKTGMLKGLTVYWMEEGSEKEDKFVWVGNRDDVFARMVGAGGKKWLNL